MLRKKSCRCGYEEIQAKNAPNSYILEIWNPPNPKIIYCRLTATSQDKLRIMLSKGNYPEKLKEITSSQQIQAATFSGLGATKKVVLSYFDLEKKEYLRNVGYEKSYK